MYGSFDTKFPNARDNDVSFTKGAPTSIKIFPIGATQDQFFGDKKFFYFSLECDIGI
jgi:hypothetical protein